MIRENLPPESGMDQPDEGCDILVLILRRVMVLAPDVDQQLLERIDAEVRAAYGGLRVRIPKRGKHMNQQERQALYTDALTDAPTPELLRKHKISLATLKRVVKRGPF